MKIWRVILKESKDLSRLGMSRESKDSTRLSHQRIDQLLLCLKNLKKSQDIKRLK